MPRPPRYLPANYVCHVTNRGVFGTELFSDQEGYETFISILSTSQKKFRMKICAYCLMPNHWHLALWPDESNQVSIFIHYATTLHVKVWNKRWKSNGHIYQGRFKSRVIENTNYYYNLVKYIEQNPIKAGLVKRAEQWQWSSAAGSSKLILSPGPVPLPDNWLDIVNS